jgi:hypothetical protein
MAFSEENQRLLNACLNYMPFLQKCQHKNQKIKPNNFQYKALWQAFQHQVLD